MDCINHPGTESAATCISCGQLLCGSCVIQTPDGQCWCRSCAITGGSLTRRDPGGLAIASLVVSIASIFICPFASLPGMVMGFVELGKIRRGESPREGRGLALAGAIVGAIVLGLTVLVFVSFIAIAILAAIFGS